MRSSKTIHVVSCHAEGEVGDVIVGGVAPPPGATLWEQSRWIARDQTLRNFVLNEPRGGVFRHVNLLVPPKDPRAAMGFIIMEPVHTPPMSGSNSMCVATVLLDTGIVAMSEPETIFYLEAPAGLVQVRAECRDGKAVRVEIQNVPSFVDKLDTMIEVEGSGTLARRYGLWWRQFRAGRCQGDVGFELVPDEAADLAAAGMRIRAAANEQLGFTHPENAGVAPHLVLPVHEACRDGRWCEDGLEYGCDRTWQTRSVALWHGMLSADGGDACARRTGRG